MSENKVPLAFDRAYLVKRFVGDKTYRLESYSANEAIAKRLIREEQDRVIARGMQAVIKANMEHNNREWVIPSEPKKPYRP